MKANKKAKVYAVWGYMEFVASIPLHPGKSIDIHFSGGKQNGYGISPARFVTSDTVLQKYIEKSPLFIRGVIRSHR